MAEKNAIALLSDVDKNDYNEGKYCQIAPLMFQKINEKIDGKSGNQRTLLMYLIFQQQNGEFHPAESTILKACDMQHAQYVNARKALADKGLIEYVPMKFMKILYQKIME